MDGQSQEEGVVSTGGQVGGGSEEVGQSHDTLSVEGLVGTGLVGDCVGWTALPASCVTESVQNDKLKRS